MVNNLRALRDLSEFKTEHPLCHELPYWDFLPQENCAVLSDGSLVQGLKLKGVSIETWEEEGVNRLTTTLRSALNSLPDEAELQFFVDVNSDYSTLIEEHHCLRGSNPLLAWLSDVRVEQLRTELSLGTLTKPNLYLFVYHRIKSARFKLRSFLEAPKKFQQVRASEHEARARELSQLTGSVRENLIGAGIGADVLPLREMTGLIYRFLNPSRSQDQPAPRLSEVHRDQEFTPTELKEQPGLSLPSPREQITFSDLIQKTDHLYLDGYFHRVLTLKTLPEATHSALISKLLALPFHFSLSMQLRVPEQSKELSALQTRRRMAHSMSISQAGRVTDLESEAKLHSTEELLRELIQTGSKIFYFQLAIILREKFKEQIDQKTKAILSCFREMNGAEGLVETVAGFKVLKTCLPAGSATTVRAKRTKTDNLADFLPVYQAWEGAGKPVCLFRNRAGGLVSYDPFDPVRLPNFSSLTTGSSGAGKSFLNSAILCQVLTQGTRLYVIDIGGSYRKLCKFMGGEYVDVAPPADQKDSRTSAPAFQSINPFQLPDGEAEPSPRKLKFLLSFLETILTDQEGDKLGKLDKSYLEEAITNTYQKCLPARMPRLSDLSEVLASWPEQDGTDAAQKLKSFSKMLYPWTGARPYGRLLDTDQSFHVNSDFVVFDLKGLSCYPDLQSAMLLVITDLILGKVDSEPGRPGRILLDEVWELLKSQGAQSFMEYCVRTLRKSFWGVSFVTQGLEEIIASPIGPAILNNTATKIILLQRGDLEPIRSVLKLNAQEMALISSLKQIKGSYSEAFLIVNEERGVIRIMPTPLEYWLSTTDALDNALLASTEKTHPEFTFPDLIYYLARHYPSGSQGAVQEKSILKAA